MSHAFFRTAAVAPPSPPPAPAPPPPAPPPHPAFSIQRRPNPSHPLPPLPCPLLLMAAAPPQIIFLYGSQTGNAEVISKGDGMVACFSAAARLTHAAQDCTLTRFHWDTPPQSLASMTTQQVRHQTPNPFHFSHRPSDPLTVGFPPPPLDASAAAGCTRPVYAHPSPNFITVPLH